MSTPKQIMATIKHVLNHGIKCITCTNVLKTK